MMRPAARVRRTDQAFKDLDFGQIMESGLVKLVDALYYQRKIDVVGRVVAVRREGGQNFANFEVSGTQDEEFLKAVSGKKDRIADLHLCDDGCGGTVTGELVIHSQRFKKVKKEEEAWYSNMEQSVHEVEAEEDELERLRAAALEKEKEAKGDAKSPKEKKKKHEGDEKKKKKKKKEKKTKETPKKEGSEDSSEEDEMEVGQVALKQIFRGTGLDPKYKRRNKVLKRARKIGQGEKKKDKKKDDSTEEDSGSGSSSGTSSGGDAGMGIFESDKKVKVIARRCPGALTASSLGEAKESLLMSSGTTWAMDKRTLAPLFTHFTRQQLGANMGPALLQEALTLSTCLDSILSGKVAFGCDILSQRLKALEALSRGCHWTVGREMELVSVEGRAMAEEQEARDAAKRAKEAEKLKGLMGGGNTPSKGSGYQGKGPGKRDKGGKGQQKGKTDNGGRGQGGDGRRDDKKQWENKTRKSSRNFSCVSSPWKTLWRKERRGCRGSKVGKEKQVRGCEEAQWERGASFHPAGCK